MADVEFDKSGPRGPLLGGREQWREIVNWAGALTSVALVVGVAVWGYRLAVRNVAGVPVIQALNGPLRIAPDDPGGKIAQNEGLAVNAVAGGAAVAGAPARVVLAPKPITLSADDKAEADLSGAAPAADGARPASAQPDPAEGDTAGADDAAAQVSVPQMGGPVVMSLLPRVRPAHFTPAAASAPKPAEVDAASLAPGTNMVQLGAYPDIAAARAGWAELAGQFDALMADKSRVIQKAQAGGRVFYRLRAVGFDDEPETRAFCAALDAGNAACIPVVSR